MSDYQTFMKLSRPAETTIIRLWHWASDPDATDIAESYDSGIREKDILTMCHPAPTLDAALEQLGSLVYAVHERWTLRLVLVTGAELAAHLNTFDNAKTMSVHPSQILSLVEWDRGGAVKWLASDLPARTEARITKAMERAWRECEAQL
jgi:hypothetical protein